MDSNVMKNWEKAGFARKPERFTSKGAEFLFRCYSLQPRKPIIIDGELADMAGSFLYGNCLFAPNLSGTGPIRNVIDTGRKKRWTWTYLERQLNAWFWGNDYERVAMFKLNPDIAYMIGPVGQDTMADAPHKDRHSGKIVSSQRHLAWPGVVPELMQIVLEVPGRSLKSSITLIEDWAVPGAPNQKTKVWI